MAGNVKVNVLQLGDSSTATQNAVWQTNADGTFKLARGNAGATTQDLITVDSGGNVSGTLQLKTPTTTTSGTFHDYTGIATGAKRITISLSGVSTNGTSNPLIQIGDSGGIENTGYLGAGSRLQNSTAIAAANYTTGFGIATAADTNVIHGSLVLTLVDSATNTWVASGNFGLSSSLTVVTTAGSKALSAVLDRVRITTVNGTDAFDAGTINILVEY